MAKAKKKKKKIKALKVKKIRKVPKTRKILVVKKKKARRIKKIAKPRKPRKIAHFLRSQKMRIKKAKPAEKKIKADLVPKYQPDALFKAKIKVIGIGGGGGSIVSEMGKSLEKATFLVADTDIRALKNKSGIKYFWFGEEFTHGLGTGVNVDLARQAAEGAREKISSFFEGQDIIIFVASLGGGLGSGATQVFVDVAKQFGGITFGIFTMPFKFEGKNKYKIAQIALKSLRKSLNVSLVIPNEKIFKVIDESTPITNAFSTVNKSLIGSLESLIDLIYNPGIINIDFADLRTILRGRGNSAFLNTIETSGKNKVEKICENIFKNPLLQNSAFKAEKILFNIAGSEHLSMFEIEKISSHISSSNPKAKIIFGISKSSRLKNKIKTTILMAGGDGDNAPEIIPEPIKIHPVKLPNGKISPKAKLFDRVKKKEKNEKTPLERILDLPIFEAPVPSPALEQRLNIIETPAVSSKKTIRRSALEIREAEDLQEKKKIAQEKEWEIPAFLRKVKFKS